MGPSAKVVADSVSPAGHRLITLEIVFHRFILAELNTHRVLSKNSASSRAIPVSKQIKRIQQDNGPAMPVSFPVEQKGMQGGEELDEGGRLAAENIWTRASGSAIEDAMSMVRVGVHKSVTNRLLEPFSMHTAVISGTSWKNFFALRANPMAQPEIKMLAELMSAAVRRSTPDLLAKSDWHLPYIQDDERAVIDIEDLVKISSARCARVSYLTQDGRRDPMEDLVLYERLTSADPMHSSPLEHVATPAPDNTHDVVVVSRTPGRKRSRTLTLPTYGNFLGWHQHRFDVEAIRGYQSFQ